jgi:Sec-independent protein translocase protein TatA
MDYLAAVACHILGKSLGEFKKARREFEEELMKAEKAVEPEKKDEKKEEAP